jgi:hypothetical protein
MSGIRLGEVVRIYAARPSWWRVFALVRWWLKRGERRRNGHGYFRVVSVTNTTLTLK